MTSPVKPMPDGYNRVMPYVAVHDAAAALVFYAKAFGAKERLRLPMPGDKIGHAEITIGDSVVMLADECPQMGIKSAQRIGGSPISLLVYVDDVDKVYAQALAAGGKAEHPVENKFYGDRSGAITDPFGITWHLATHVEDVPHDELQRRVAAMAEGTNG